MDVLSELASRSLPVNGHKWSHRVCLFDALFPDMAIMPPTPAADTKPDTPAASAEPSAERVPDDAKPEDPAASAEPSSERKPQDAELDIKSVWGSPKKNARRRACQPARSSTAKRSLAKHGRGWTRAGSAVTARSSRAGSPRTAVWVLLGEGGPLRPEVQGRRLQLADLAGDAD